MLTKFVSINNVQKLFIIAGSVIIYFFMIRPKQKEEQARLSFLKELKLGIQVITIGGLHGKIKKVDDNTVVLEVDPRGFCITINKKALSSINTIKS